MRKIYKKIFSLLIFSIITASFLFNNFNSKISIKNPDLKEINQKDQTHHENGMKLQNSGPKNMFLYYKNITINDLNNGISTLKDFPFLLDIYDSDLHDYVQTDGDDITFFNGSLKLDHEMVNFNYTYNNTHAHLIAWVRIPFVPPSIDIVIQMYFGNPTMDSQENPEGVWDSEYKAVWHLEENPDGPILDSTKYNNDGNAASGMVSDDLFPCIVGNGLNFTGSNKYIDCGNDNSLALTGGLTIEFWIFANSTEFTNNRFVLQKENSYSLIQYWSIGTGKQTFHFFLGGGVDFFYPSIPTDTWCHFVIVSWIKNGLTHVESYVNGQKTKEGDNSFIIPERDTSFYISDHNLGGLSSLDEIRLSNTNRSADWIKTSYDNQVDPSSFCSVGQKEKLSTYIMKPTDFQCSKIITINHSKVIGTGSYKNFPLLINILDPYLHEYAQEDGSDIMFYNGTDWLDFEIEYYNHSYKQTSAKLIAWVRIPSLNTSSDTQIKIYFGNSTMISQQNPLRVWNHNYMGVWHIGDNSSKIIKDSSPNHNDGKSYGSLIVNNEVKGKIARSINLDGIDDFIDIGNHSSLDFGISDSITMEAWIFSNNISSENTIISKSDLSAFLPSYQMGISEGKINVSGGASNGFMSNDSIISNSWHYIVATISGGIGKIYIDGKLNGSDNTQSIASQPELKVLFGCSWENYPNKNFFYNGSLDEIRISNIERSADWIATQYNNQFEPNNFYSIGSLSTAPLSFQLDSNATIPDIDGIFTLNWSISNGAKNYSLCWDTSEITGFPSHNLLLDEGLVNYSRTIQISNGTYYFIAIAYNESGKTLSNCIKVVVFLPPAQFNLNCNATYPDIDGIFTINWSTSEWAKNYSIFYSNESFSVMHGNVSLLEEGLTNKSRTIKFPRGEFYFQIVAFNEVGNCSSNEIVVYINLPPGTFSLSSDIKSLDANGFILITWSPSEGALNYSLYQDNKFINEYRNNLTLIAEGIKDNFHRFHVDYSGTYYFLAVAFNEVGNQSTECFTINIVLPPVSLNNDDDDDNNKSSDNANNDFFVIIIIIIASISGLIGAFGYLYTKSIKNIKTKDIRKEISLKFVISHIDKIFHSVTGESENQNGMSKTVRVIKEDKEIDKRIIKFKQNVIELYLNGAYLESLKEIKNSINFLKKLNKEDDLVFFSNLYDRINDLVKSREDKLILLETAKLNNNIQEILFLYEEIIEISKELNDTVSIEMYNYEMESYQNQNK